MVSVCYFMIIKCFSFFEIPIFKATVAILQFGGKILKFSNLFNGSVNLPDGQREGVRAKRAKRACPRVQYYMIDLFS